MYQRGHCQPIIETPEDALAFFVDSELDVLYINNYRIEKRQ